MKVGIFDSGIGGLSVLNKVIQYMPQDKFIYYADEKNVPYGEKSREEIIGYVDEIVNFMIEKQVDAIVIACNTATSVAVDLMRKKYKLPIIGMEPAIKKAIDLYGDRRVLAAATPVTVTGEKMRCLMEKVDKEHLVDLVPLPQLVRFAERQIFNSSEVENYLYESLQQYKFEEYSSIVLGCTHFNYFKQCFRKILPSTIHFIDGIEGTIHRLMQQLKIEGSEAEESIDYSRIPQQVEFYSSGEKLNEQRTQHVINAYMKWLYRMEKVQ